MKLHVYSMLYKLFLAANIYNSPQNSQVNDFEWLASVTYDIL